MEDVTIVCVFHLLSDGKGSLLKILLLKAWMKAWFYNCAFTAQAAVSSDPHIVAHFQFTSKLKRVIRARNGELRSEEGELLGNEEASRFCRITMNSLLKNLLMKQTVSALCYIKCCVEIQPNFGPRDFLQDIFPRISNCFVSHDLRSDKLFTLYSLLFNFM